MDPNVSYRFSDGIVVVIFVAIFHAFGFEFVLGGWGS